MSKCSVFSADSVLMPVLIQYAFLTLRSKFIAAQTEGEPFWLFWWYSWFLLFLWVCFVGLWIGFLGSCSRNRTVSLKRYMSTENLLRIWYSRIVIAQEKRKQKMYCLSTKLRVYISTFYYMNASWWCMFPILTLHRLFHCKTEFESDSRLKIR